jgi:hypothetical protein
MIARKLFFTVSAHEGRKSGSENGRKEVPEASETARDVLKQARAPERIGP